MPASKKGDLVHNTHFKKLFHYKYLIRDIDTDHVKIYFQHHIIDRIYMNAIGVFLQAQVLEPVMYLKLMESGVFFMHAGGIARDNRGYLMAAHGGTGKTTFSIALLNCGFKLLGDDLLFVDTNKGIVHPYPRPMHIFTYNINNLKGAKVPFKYRFYIYIKDALRFILEKILRVELLISTRIHADEVFEGEVFSNSVPYKSLFFLRKTGAASRQLKLNPSNYESVASEIMMSADLNQSLYDLVGDKIKEEKIKNLEIKTITRLLSQMGSLVYINTRKLDLNNLDSFINKSF